ncbi:MAG TPA: tyrosine-type recombinase/integrase [Candidatus Methanofastidiosa archaeon]|nr:tyrosine-type recombinase/integrase [Candidatus Methanofastidiosa archaeon]
MKAEIEEMGNKFYLYCIQKGLAKGYCKSLKNLYLYCVKRSNNLMPGPKDFSIIYLDMVDKDRSPSYIANVIKMANHFCDFSGVERPALKAPKNTRRRIVYLTEVEAKRLLYVCTDFRDYALLCVLLYGGLRRGEARNLKISDINFQERVLTITTTKTHIEAECIMSEKTSKALSQWLAHRPETDNDYVFVKQNGDPLSDERIGYLVKKYVKRAGLKKQVSTHTLRHTLATNLLINGADITLVQKQLRHQNIQSTLIYTHITTEKQKEMYDKFSPDF